MEYVLMAVSVGVALCGVFLARLWYLRKKEMPGRIMNAVPGWYKLLFNKYYVDEVYDAAVVNPLARGSEKVLWRGVDVGMIDWCVNALPKTIGWISGTMRRVQTGVTQNYALVFVAGVVTILVLLLTK